MDKAERADPGKSDTELRKAAYTLAAVGIAMAEVGIRASLRQAHELVKELERNGYVITKLKDAP